MKCLSISAGGIIWMCHLYRGLETHLRLSYAVARGSRTKYFTLPKSKAIQEYHYATCLRALVERLKDAVTSTAADAVAATGPAQSVPTP